MEMRKQMPKLDAPLNADERLLYAIAVRLDKVIELLEDKEEVIDEITTPEEVVDEVEIEIDYTKITKQEIMDILTYKDVEFNKSSLKSELIELLESIE